MRAAIAEAPRTIALRERPEPSAPAAGQTLLRPEVVGICGSDLHTFRADMGAGPGRYPRVMGHEFSAVVAAPDPAGGGPGAGERVVVWPVHPCGTCRSCRTGRPNVCFNLRLIGVHFDGALQDHTLVDTAQLIAVPDLSAEQAALVEPVSIAVHTVVRARVADGESVVILGGGPIGLATALAARDRGASVLVVDPVASRRARLEQLGFATTDPDGAAAAAADHAGLPEGPDVIVDSTGKAAVFAQAVELAGHGGRLAVVGLTGETAQASPGPFPHKELDILGVSCCTHEDVAASADLVGRCPEAVDALVSHIKPLEQTAGALELLDEHPEEAYKVLIDLREGAA